MVVNSVISFRILILHIGLKLYINLISIAVAYCSCSEAYFVCTAVFKVVFVFYVSPAFSVYTRCTVNVVSVFSGIFNNRYSCT